MSSLQGKVALVTGASSGIGAAIAAHFASLGCYLAIGGRDVTKMEAVSKECEKNGLSKDKILCVPGDITIDEVCVNIVESTVKHFGHLDILVNNAGGGFYRETIETVSMERFDHSFNLNVRALFHLSKLAVPHLIKTKGNIVNVSSMTSLSVFPGGLLCYSVAKSAVDHFTKFLAVELGSKQVRVNAINPGVIDTDCHKKAGLNDEEYDRLMEAAKDEHVFRRCGTAGECAKLTAFLASDDAAFITGAIVPIDGGLHAAGSYTFKS
ncbi:3-oxoacyl-[acyl-carrier-protein] reductase FabG-like [Saccoglossus kowalevskii]|uniref:Tropinone reductase 2-like n=1 Tax=Saccoglossus kowalevskii TaxID=10224 RepID=A0ABM0GZJ4_SACKO|nr:PREDICTED: tropinone reductase 2-like [Saccoglossus kowalevskii]